MNKKQNANNILGNSQFNSKIHEFNQEKNHINFINSGRESTFKSFDSEKS